MGCRSVRRLLLLRVKTKTNLEACKQQWPDLRLKQATQRQSLSWVLQLVAMLPQEAGHCHVVERVELQAGCGSLGACRGGQCPA